MSCLLVRKMAQMNSPSASESESTYFYVISYFHALTLNRLVFSRVIIQVICSYITLPLYAIVTHVILHDISFNFFDVSYKLAWCTY